MILSWIYRGIYIFTKILPTKGWKIIDGIILFLGGNRIVYSFVLFFYRRKIRRIRQTNRICILTDVNIGDAIAMQGIISGLRDFFPESSIDFVIPKSATSLISHNPQVTTLYPLYTTSPHPSPDDLQSVISLIQKNNYDLVINMSPFLSVKEIKKYSPMIGFLGFAFCMLRKRALKEPVHLFSYTHTFIHTLLHTIYPSIPSSAPPLPFVFLPKAAIDSASEFLKSHKKEPSPLIFFNREAASPYTFIPESLQFSLLEKLLKHPVSIIVPIRNKGSESFLEFIHTLPQDQQEKCIFLPIPTLLDTYAALIDMSDVVITGDTGPLHIAAARKLGTSSSYSFKNKTAIFSLFGATDSYMYGYDSFRPSYTPAQQDAPSRVYIGSRRYRTLAHINKNSIYGDPSLFFSDIDVDAIVSDIVSYLDI